MPVRVRGLACAENQRQRTQKQEAADGRRNMCFHVSAWRCAITVCAQHCGEAGKSVCESGARVASIEMPCELDLLSIRELAVEAGGYAQPHQLAVGRGEPIQRSLSSPLDPMSWGAPHHHHRRSV